MINTVEKSVLESIVATKKDMEYLLGLEEFQNVFLKEYMRESLNEMIYREGSSNGVIKALDARKQFNDFVYDIINEGTKAEELLKGK